MVILDGWGIGRRDASNPIYTANPPTINFIKENYLMGSLQAAGIAVGLPWNEESNSQVGHLMLGAGKIIYQNLPRITLAVEDGSFYHNEALRAAFDHAKKNGTRVHLAGLLSDEEVHSSFDHLLPLIMFARAAGIPPSQIFVHFFMDKKDASPKKTLELLTKFREKAPDIKIASIAGSYFSMDIDKHFDRTALSYRAMTEPGETKATPEDVVAASYARDLPSTFIRPTTFLKEGAVRPKDSIVFFNFRETNMRQLVQFFVNASGAIPSNEHRTAGLAELHGLHITTFTEYSKSFPVSVAFPPERIEAPLGKVLADAGKIQLRIAETERYPHVTFFFNGLRQEPFPNEYRVLIPSRNVPKQEAHPEMMAEAITERALTAIAERAYDLILINYANADVMARTENYDAVTSAVLAVDAQVKRIMEATLAAGSYLLITSGHGNAERVVDPLTGMPETKNDADPVPFYLVGKPFERKKTPDEAYSLERENVGVLSDVAASVLDLLHIPKPKEMTGVSILGLLR